MMSAVLWTLLGVVFLARVAIYTALVNICRDKVPWAPSGLFGGVVLAVTVGIMANGLVGDLAFLVEFTSTMFVLYYLWDHRYEL